MAKWNYKWVRINGKQITEHKHIMQQHLGRTLEKHEVVHHKNENPQDNRIENLELTTRKEHSLYHAIKDEAGKRISTGYGIDNPFYGRKHKDRTKKAISEKNTRHDISIEKIKKLMQEGMLLKDIAKELGCGLNTISRRLKKNNIVVKVANRSDVTAELIKEYIKKDYTYSEIAKELNCCIDILFKRMRLFDNTK